jgi:hypothetical protein
MPRLDHPSGRHQSSTAVGTSSGGSERSRDQALTRRRRRDLSTASPIDLALPQGVSANLRTRSRLIALSFGSAAIGVTGGYSVAAHADGALPWPDWISPKLVLATSVIGLITSLGGLLKAILLRRIDVVDHLVSTQSVEKQLDTICNTHDGNYIEAEWHPNGQLKRLKLSPAAPRKSAASPTHPAASKQSKVSTPQPPLRVIGTPPSRDNVEPHT